MPNPFPTKLARGSAFCNRKSELKRLKNNVKAINPVLIISPRRYGKTSLAFKAIDSIKWPYVHIDLYKAFSEEDIERIILNGIGELLSKLESAPKKLISLASDFFSSLHVSVSIESSGLKLDFSKRKKNPSENILNAFHKLHALAKKRRKKVILYLDEFQVIGEVTNNYAIEAILREIAQQSENIAFIYSGSDRHLIDELFNDKKRPFYNLCDIIRLDRISEHDYVKYLQKVSMIHWKSELSEKTLSMIFEYTERHSFYFNKLCSILWQSAKPTPNMVTDAWESFVSESKSSIERELSLLAINQRRILMTLASTGGTNEPFSKQFLSHLNLSNSSASRAMKVLIEKDYVLETEEGLYKVLDPLIRSILE